MCLEAIRYGHDRIVQCLIRHGCSWTQDGAGDILCAAVGKSTWSWQTMLTVIIQTCAEEL